MTNQPRHPVLGQGAAFWVAAAVVVHTLWTSAAPAVSYPLYAAAWHLTPTVTTGIFAVYPIAVVATLLLFGNLSDHIGRRAAMLWGLAASFLGVLCFAIANDVAWLFVGRAAMGIGVGLSASPATAALVEFGGEGRNQRANSIATAATCVGLALAVLAGGALIQYAPFPMHLNFWVLCAVIALMFGAAWFLPRHTRDDDGARWRPSAIAVPRSIRLIFATSAMAVTAGYSIGAILLSVGASIARELIGSGNALVNGAALALFALVSGVVALAAKPLPARLNIVAGAVASTLGMGLLMLAGRLHSLAVFLPALAAIGAAYSFSVLGGLTLINAHAPPHERGATLSAIYLIGYLLMGLIAFSIGLVATAHGLESALDFGAPVVAALSVIAAALSMTVTRRGLAAERSMLPPRPA
jgi:predicted MFS family arabinose efflux permease